MRAALWHWKGDGWGQSIMERRNGSCVPFLRFAFLAFILLSDRPSTGRAAPEAAGQRPDQTPAQRAMLGCYTLSCSFLFSASFFFSFSFLFYPALPLFCLVCSFPPTAVVTSRQVHFFFFTIVQLFLFFCWHSHFLSLKPLSLFSLMYFQTLPHTFPLAVTCPLFKGPMTC